MDMPPITWLKNEYFETSLLKSWNLAKFLKHFLYLYWSGTTIICLCRNVTIFQSRCHGIAHTYDTPRSFIEWRDPISCSRLVYNYSLLRIIRSPISCFHPIQLLKKIGKRRGPAEQVARQTRYPNVDATGLASPEVNTMRQQLELTASKHRTEIEFNHSGDRTIH